MDDARSPETLRLFQEKLFYKIGEVSRMLGVESYVLRYWETEFPFLTPRKSRSGQRIYTKNDIALLMEIRRLLYEERYTIAGVRKKLGAAVPADEGGETGTTEVAVDARDVIRTVKERLTALLKRLS